jgi:hypothetical protein
VLHRSHDKLGLGKEIDRKYYHANMLYTLVTSDSTEQGCSMLTGSDCLMPRSLVTTTLCLLTCTTGTLAAFYIFAGPYLVLNSLMGLGVVPMNTRVHVLYMLITLMILTDVNVVSRHAWGEVGTGVSVSISKTSASTSA